MDREYDDWRERQDRIEAKAPREPFDDPGRCYCERCEVAVISERVAASDEPYCEGCIEDMRQQQIDDNAAEPPPTMAELHAAAWQAKQRSRA